MQHVYVHKDIGEYEEKVVGKLSGRMLVCVALAIATSVGTAAFCHLALGVSVQDASAPVMLASMPFWLAGFWRPKGMRPERFVPLMVRHTLQKGVIVYRPAIASAMPAPKLAAQPAYSKRQLKKLLRKRGEGGYEETPI